MASSIFMTALLLAAVLSIATTTSVAYAQEGGGMRGTTSKGTLDILVEPTWDENGRATFRVSFLNPGTDTLHEHQDYDFRIFKDGAMIFSAAQQTDQPLIHNVEGTITVPYTFQENGDYTIQIFLGGTGIAPPIPTEEEVEFTVTVVPEFPIGIVGAVIGATMAGSLLFARWFSRR
ncbi:MAG TPA: hypothetical protein VNI77_00150 [Nitrososphaera sp.]|nr:hypothetical protein [Nitrososphaera sp.]